MASAWCLSAPAITPAPAPGALGASASRGVSLPWVAVPARRRRRWDALVVCMAPDEEKITRRSLLDFPIEFWPQDYSIVAKSGVPMSSKDEVCLEWRVREKANAMFLGLLCGVL